VFKSISLLSVMALGIVGCDVQRGRFSTSGDSSEAFLSHLGCIEIVSGSGSKPFNTVDSDEQNLLYLLIVCPGVQVHGSGSSSDYGEYITTLNHSWDTEAGTISVKVCWDRQSDTVSIGKDEFARDKGNVFVVQFDAGGKMAAQQLASLGPHVGFQEALQNIQRQLSNDGLITSLKLNR
jgi:hypothetical protein